MGKQLEPGTQNPLRPRSLEVALTGNSNVGNTSTNLLTDANRILTLDDTSVALMDDPGHTQMTVTGGGTDVVNLPPGTYFVEAYLQVRETGGVGTLSLYGLVIDDTTIDGDSLRANIAIPSNGEAFVPIFGIISQKNDFQLRFGAAEAVTAGTLNIRQESTIFVTRIGNATEA